MIGACLDESSKVIKPPSLSLIPGLQIYSPSYSSATSQLDFRQYQGLLRNPDLEPDSFRHESVSARRIYEFKSYRDGQVKWAFSESEQMGLIGFVLLLPAAKPAGQWIIIHFLRV